MAYKFLNQLEKVRSSYYFERPYDVSSMYKLESYIQEHKANPPEALCWDDIFVMRTRAGERRATILKWPSPTELVLRQVSHAGRCAIRKDVMERLHREGKISKPTDTTEALHAILREGGKIDQIDRLFRIVDDNGETYQRTGRVETLSAAPTRISVIINYRDRSELTIACLDSLFQQSVGANTVEVILVNNQSTPEENAKVLEFARANAPAAFTIVGLDYDKPYNHSAQCNLAASQATGKVLVMLNNDATLQSPTLLNELAAWAQLPEIGTVGPRCIGNEGKLISSGMVIWETGSAKIEQGFGIKESAIEPLATIVRETVGNSFSCAAIEKAKWEKIGGLDAETFPAQYNDADFTLRAIRQGYKNMYLGHLTIFHQPGASSTDKTKDTIRALRQAISARYPEIAQYQRRNPYINDRPMGLEVQHLQTRLAFKALKVTHRMQASGLPFTGPVANAAFYCRKIANRGLTNLLGLS